MSHCISCHGIFHNMPYLIAVSLIWGFSFIIIKGSLVSLDPAFVSFARLLLSLLLFLPLLRPRGIKIRETLQLMLIGSIQFGLMYLAYIAAFRDLPAHVVALMTTTTPIFVSIFAALHAGRLPAVSLAVAVLAFAGGAVLEFPDQPLAASLRGIILIQISNAAFAYGQIAYRKWMALRPSLKDKNLFAFPYAGAVLVTGLFWLAGGDFEKITVQPHQWLALLYLGIIASGLSFFLWNAGARRVDVGLLAIMNNMKIPVAVIASLAVLGERTDWLRLAAGCALITLALYINQKAKTAAGQAS